MEETSADISDVPAYSEFILPVIRAVAELGGSAKAREIRDHVLEQIPNAEALLLVTRPNRPEAPVLIERIEWGRSYAKLIGALDTPSRGLYLMAPLGKELLQLDQESAQKTVLDLDREYRRKRHRRRATATQEHEPTDADEDEDGGAASPEEEAQSEEMRWSDVLLQRLHQLSPTGFEEFILFLLRRYGLELRRVGGGGDEGIDGIGTAPISPVLSSRVAVQVKRHDPNGRSVGRETVALFQRDAQTKGAERAILVTLGRFSDAARKAATVTSPTVDLIDGERLTELIREQSIGVRMAPQVDTSWFDRFDSD